MSCSAPIEPVASPMQTQATVSQPELPHASVQSVAGQGIQADGSLQVAGARFPVLRFVAKLLKILAVVEVAGASIFGVSLAASSQPSPAFGGAGGALGALAGLLGLSGFFIAVILGLLGGLYSWAAADFILVFLAVEENTRAIRFGVK